MKFKYLIAFGLFLPGLVPLTGAQTPVAAAAAAGPAAPVSLAPASMPIPVPVASAVLWPPDTAEVRWQDPGFLHKGSTLPKLRHLHLLAVNDFHGNLETPVAPDGGRPAGGAAVLAAYLEAAQRRDPKHTLIVHAGDMLGASPPITGLLRNEPGIQFLNLLADPRRCPLGRATHFYRKGPGTCNVIGTLGNHEFDGGLAEIQRLLNGGNAAKGPYLEQPWRGSRVPYVSANVIDRRTGRTLLPPYAVVDVGGTAVGVIGAVLRDTAPLIPPWVAKDVEFTDEAEAINRAAAELVRRGVRVIVVNIHQGLVPVRENGAVTWTGGLREVVARLDPAVDVVISGHTHNFTNTLLPNRAGRPVLVTQAYSMGLAYAEIELGLDARGRVRAKSARVLPAWADAGPGLKPDARVATLVRSARDIVAPRVAAVLAQADRPITRAVNSAGESALGDLVADSQREAMQADVAFMNPGGMRTDLRAGAITRGDLMTVQPFGNHVLAVRMTGAQLLAVLEEQWPRNPSALPRVLKISGLSYVWDPARPVGSRVVAACGPQGRPLDPAAGYRVAVNDFLVGGGDDFRGFEQPVEQVGPLDTDALEQYLATRARDGRPATVDPQLEGRISVPGVPGQCAVPVGG